MKKRAMWGILAVSTLSLALTACAGGAAQNGEKGQEKQGKTEVTMMYFNQLPTFEALVESTYEDIDLVVEQNSSATLDNESERRLKNHHGSDLIMTTLPGGIVSDYTYDISAEEFVLNYSGAITKQILINGETHYVPLPGQYYGYLINKTLVEELGFELPKSNQDLYAILAAAQEQGLGIGNSRDCVGFYNIGETNLANMVFGNYVPDFLSLPEGIIWLSELQEGKGKFSGNVEPALDFLTHCVDQGYIDPGYALTSSSVTISNKNAVHVVERMLERTMVLAYGDTELYQRLVTESEGDEFVMLPFLSYENRPGWLISVGNGFLAVNKYLEEDGHEEKLEAALNVLDLLSTEEGQKAWINDTDAVFSYLKDSGDLVQDLPEGIRDTVAAGNVFNSTLPNNLAQYFGRQVNMVVLGKSTVEEAMVAVDNYTLNGSESGENSWTVVGSVSEDLIYKDYNTRKEETAIGNLIADAVREYSGADIALVNGGGIRSSLYKGEVWEADLDAVCPYGNRIITVELTGKTLKEALTNGISQTDRGESVPAGRFLQVSGLCYSYRPMKNENDVGELLQVTLPDGTPIDDNETYFVAITDYMAGASTYQDGNGDGYEMLNVYDDEVEKNVVLVSETEATYRDALQSYFTNHDGDDVSSKLEGRIVIED